MARVRAIGGGAVRRPQYRRISTPRTHSPKKLPLVGRRGPGYTPRMNRHLLICGLSVIVAGLMPAADAGATGPHQALPDAFVELQRQAHREVLTVHLRVDWEVLGGRLSEVQVETLQRRYLEDAGAEVMTAMLLARRPAEDRARMPWLGDEPVGDWLPLIRLVRPPAPVPRREHEAERPPPPPPTSPLNGDPAVGGVKGALSGKTVYLSPGHGWTWSPGMGRWHTQRGNTHDIVEDFVNAEGALHYLVPLLLNAGARVVGARALDLQSHSEIVADGAPKSGYSEVGTWQKGTNPGFAAGKAPYKDGVNPFALGGYRATKAVKGKPTATASFVPKIPATGRYAVYVGYTAGNNRVADAHFEIRHAGGVEHRRVDMRKHGQTWTRIGYFPFYAGSDPAKGAVLLHNDTLGDPSGKYVIADVVRFGGGMGVIARGKNKPPASGATTLRPAWESNARYHTQYMGAPKSVYDYSSSGDGSDDVGARSRFAAWHPEAGEAARYLAWHSHPPDPARGTSTYVYGPGKPWSGAPFTGVKGSMELAKLLQKTLVADIRATFDKGWKDRGVRTAWFGEVNPKHNPEMPAALVECAFHSTKADADFLRQPRFRHLVARAMYKSIVGYFAAKGGPSTIAPEPPAALSATVHDDGKNPGVATMKLTWKAGATGGVHGGKATSWLVQTSTDGFGFDAGTSSHTTSMSIPLGKRGETTFVRVLAVNAGGVSLPSSVVGVVRGCGPSAALAVQGFSRMAAGQLPIDDL